MEKRRLRPDHLESKLGENPSSHTYGVEHNVRSPILFFTSISIDSKNRKKSRVLTKSSIEKDRDRELREGEVRGKILILSPSWDLRMDLPPFFQIGFSSTPSMTVYTHAYRQKGI